jgi:hypothetical protein
MAYVAGLSWFTFDGRYGNYSTLQGYEVAARTFQQRRVAGDPAPVPTIIAQAPQFVLRQRLKIVEAAAANRPLNADDDTISRENAEALQTVLELFDIHMNTLRGPDGHSYLVLESVDTLLQLRAIRAATPAATVMVPRGPCRVQDAYLGGAPPLLLETLRAFRIPCTNVCYPVGAAAGGPAGAAAGGPVGAAAGAAASYVTIPIRSAAEFTATCIRFGLTYNVPTQPSPEEVAVAAGNPARLFVRVFRPSGPVASFANASAVLLDAGAAFDILERVGALRALD